MTVRDGGVGLDEAEPARLLEPFFTTKPGGLGMGLSISRSIVESHGGSLTARNRDGGGSEFAVSLGYSARSAVSASTFSARRDGR